MKIFNWVHRKFYQKDGLLSRNVKKDELEISNEIIGDAQTLLQDASFAHMFLTIGTFGFDPLKDHVQDQNDIDIEEEGLEEEYSVELDDQDCEINQEGHEELYPLIYANGHDVIEGPKELNEIMVIEGSPLSQNNESNNLESSYKTMKRERITLADLFSADSDHHGQNFKVNPEHKTDEAEIYPKKPASSLVKNGKSFAKKLIPRVKEDSRPIKKLQKLMTRVLKRKVHPDIETKSAKNNSHQVKIAAASMLGVSCVKHMRVDSVSLLQTDQDITA